MSGLDPKFEKYIKGFKKVYKAHFNKEPTMGVYVFNGWLDVKDIPGLNFEEMGKIHAELLINKEKEKNGNSN